MSQHIDHNAVTKNQEQGNKKNGSSNSKKSSSGDRQGSVDPTNFLDPSTQASHLEILLAGTDALQKIAAANAAAAGGGIGDGNKKDKGRKGFWAKKFTGDKHGSGKNGTAAAAAAGDWRKENADPPGPNQVFGIPLEDAIKVAKVSDQYELPAIVYRCIDYLEAKDAIQEEGIYRLSGSALKIRNLKSKFNEGNC